MYDTSTQMFSIHNNILINNKNVTLSFLKNILVGRINNWLAEISVCGNFSVIWKKQIQSPETQRCPVWEEKVPVCFLTFWIEDKAVGEGRGLKFEAILLLLLCLCLTNSTRNITEKSRSCPECTGADRWILLVLSFLCLTTDGCVGECGPVLVSGRGSYRNVCDNTLKRKKTKITLKSPSL